jgi:hypothetical protein
MRPRSRRPGPRWRAAVLAEARDRFPWLRHIVAGGGYAGDKLRGAPWKMEAWNLEIIRRFRKA